MLSFRTVLGGGLPIAPVRACDAGTIPAAYWACRRPADASTPAEPARAPSRMLCVTGVGDRSQFSHDTALAPTSSTNAWGSRSHRTSRQCTAHAFACSEHLETLSLPCAPILAPPSTGGRGHRP